MIKISVFNYKTIIHFSILLRYEIHYYGDRSEKKKKENENKEMKTKLS